MNNILSIYKKELRGFFYSPVAYIVIVVFLAISGWFFTSNLFVIGLVSMRGAFDIIPFILLFFIPAITMRTFSEEKKSGTIELLLTKPITDMEIVLGKFLATLVFTALTLAPTLIYVLSLTLLGPVDIGTIFTAYLGILFTCAVYISIGLFASSLTENQVVAFIITFIIIFVLFILNKILIFLPSSLASLLEYLSTDYHYTSFARGVVDTRSVIYFLSGITVFLLLTRTSLEKRKW
ncbi:MAG: ABC transporter permease subunit [Ignavibacteria bacterium]|nr:ABC transporter permease subunit [Ignavibacteria bacterium]